MNKPKHTKYAGFTLVEMAIVLVIIGIILAGVMKGRDIVRGAQVKQFSQQFAQKWTTVAQTYYDKTGQHLMDGDGNGNGNPAGTAATSAPNGRMDGGTTDTAGGMAACINIDDGVVAVLESVGITPCTLIKSKFVAQVVGPMATCPVSCVNTTGTNLIATSVEGEYSGTVIVQADLCHLVLTMGGKVVGRNCVVLYGVPLDVAQGLDTAIDGAREGRTGVCVNLVANDDADGLPDLLEESDAITTQPWKTAAPTAAEPATVTTIALVLDY